jgi:hypothetical protein
MVNTQQLQNDTSSSGRLSLPPGLPLSQANSRFPSSASLALHIRRATPLPIADTPSPFHNSRSFPFFPTFPAHARTPSARICRDHNHFAPFWSRWPNLRFMQTPASNPHLGLFQTGRVQLYLPFPQAIMFRSTPSKRPKKARIFALRPFLLTRMGPCPPEHAAPPLPSSRLRKRRTHILHLACVTFSRCGLPQAIVSSSGIPATQISRNEIEGGQKR